MARVRGAIMSAHTPGPWQIDADAPIHPTGFYAGGYHSISSTDGEFQVTGFIGDANARLIAAAPDLAEALRQCVQYIELDSEYLQPMIDRARAALAKAGVT